MAPQVLLLGQQQTLCWDSMQGMLLSAGAVILAALAGVIVLAYIRRRLFEDKRSILEDDDITLDQARGFLKRELITQEEFERLREKILARSKEKLGEPGKGPEEQKAEQGQA
ncbi:MAG: hypothetical protein V2A58_11100 [Planctomycetota bacterium]